MARRYAVVAYLERDEFREVKRLANETHISISRAAGDLIRTALPRRKKVGE